MTKLFLSPEASCLGPPPSTCRIFPQFTQEGLHRHNFPFPEKEKSIPPPVCSSQNHLHSPRLWTNTGRFPKTLVSIALTFSFPLLSLGMKGDNPQPSERNESSHLCTAVTPFVISPQAPIPDRLSLPASACVLVLPVRYSPAHQFVSSR